ncbi:MAG TPA: GNAT family N-acetyltransferase [Lachnospiraceae bacterium]|nr:GNAT family N-acetyltransferase [Lachnospiraceae bacterium]
MVYEMTNMDVVKEIFADWEETLIWSCLQGVMGKIYVDDEKNPKSAMAILGDFAFLAGNPNSSLVSFKPDWFQNSFVIMVPQTKEWGKLIEACYGVDTKKVTRYAIQKEKDIFDTDRLQQMVNGLPCEYEVSMIEESLFIQCKAESWSQDLVGQYSTYADYRKFGIGVVVLKDNKIVAGASSYSRYEEGIEIEIDTKEDYRRKGLATVCGAKLILECLKKGLYPSWDAQNLWSVALAEKLGYHFSHEYDAYEVLQY